MSHPELSQNPLLRTAATYSGRWAQILLFALALMTVAFYVPDPVFGIALAGASGTLAAVSLLVRLLARQGARSTNSLAREFAGSDRTPGVVTDDDGAVIWRNDAAQTRFPDARAETLVRALGELFANPAAVIYRLQARAQAEGAAREDVVTRQGHLRICVHRLSRGGCFWRLDEMQERGGGRGAEALGLPMMTVGRNDTILFMNEAARRFLGGRRKSLEAIFDDLPLRCGEVVEVAGADGPLDARVFALDAKSGRREIYLFPVARDETVHRGENGFAEALPVALLKLTPQGDIVNANRRARDLLGAPADATNLADLVEGLGRSVRDWLGEVVERRVAKRTEVLRVRRDDRDLYVQITLERIVENGETGLVAVLHDATELKTLEAQFVQSQKMQAIGQLAGGVAHDFNNLLTAISGHCDLLLLRHDQGDPDYADLMQINQNANRAASLVGQLLAYSRKQTLRPEVIDLHETLADLIHLLNRLVGERVSLSVSHDPQLVPIRADKRQLEQVLMNLVVNARDAMPQGGEIRIETAMHRLDEELRRDRAVVAPGDYVLVRVIDSGEGIPPDKLTKIFEPFFTTKKTGDGTGLGLSTVYGIVKQSGGFIFVDSPPGEGTCFSLYFPARESVTPQAEAEYLPDLPDFSAIQAEQTQITSQGEQTPRIETFSDPLRSEAAALHPARGETPPGSAAAGPRAAAGQAGAGETIPTAGLPGETRTGEGVVLLVEDEAPVRAFAARALKMRGFTVLEAENAEEALEALRDRAITIDVFVTDVVMPGMDGPSWVTRALEDRPETRVVFVSGYPEESFTETQSRIPNSVFLPKPFSLNELTATVREQLH